MCVDRVWHACSFFSWSQSWGLLRTGNLQRAGHQKWHCGLRTLACVVMYGSIHDLMEAGLQDGNRIHRLRFRPSALFFLRFSALESTAQQCLISVSQSTAARPGNDWLMSLLWYSPVLLKNGTSWSVGTKRYAVTTLRTSPDEGLFVTRRPGTAREMHRNDYGRLRSLSPASHSPRNGRHPLD